MARNPLTGLNSRQERHWKEQLYYGIELGLYTVMFFQEFERRDRKDFLVNCAHHVVTVILLLGSAYAKSFSLGCMVMLVHDIGDPLLDVSLLEQPNSFDKKRIVDEME